MGCILTCLGSSQDAKRCKNAPNVSTRNPNLGHQYQPIINPNPTVVAKQEDLKKPLSVIPASTVKPEEKRLSSIKQENPEEQQLNSGSRKILTFDSKVTENGQISVENTPAIIQETEKEDVKKVSNEKWQNPGKSSTVSIGGSIVSSLSSYPPNHQYQNCRESGDEEDEGLDCQLSDLDDDEDILKEDAEEDYEKFSPTLALCLGARDRGGYLHSVLNPVENTTEWKAVKSIRTPPLKLQKENFVIDSISSYKNFPQKPKSNSEVAVNASLSTWLDSSEKTPSKNGAIGLDPLVSGASASSYGSNSLKNCKQRTDEKPLVGTVGIHWIDKTPIEDSGSASSFKGIPNTTSKYREDKKVNWHSTPFETRLQRALS